MNQKELDTVLEQHSLWLSTEGQSGQRAELGRANLLGADLYEANLIQADLREADLNKANLHYANLRGANLGRANLGRANLGRANLGRANLYGANLRGAQFTLEIKVCYGFWHAQVTEDQLAWLCLHPRFGDMSETLRMTS